MLFKSLNIEMIIIIHLVKSWCGGKIIAIECKNIYEVGRFCF